MTAYEALKLCIINLDDDATNSIIKVLRSTGIPAQPINFQNEESLVQNLKNQNPDIILVGAKGAEDIAHISKVCRKQIPCVPRLLVGSSNKEAQASALQFQYDDLIEVSNEAWLIHVISREWHRYKNARTIDSLKLELHAIKESHHNVVENSDKGIAYVCDGLHVTSTQRYIDIFEFDNETNVAITPLIDIIAPSQQTQFKKQLRAFEVGDTTSCVIDTTAITLTQKPLPLRFEINKSDYDKEPALQVIVTEATPNDTGSNSNDQTPSFLKQLDYFLSLAKSDKQQGCVVCLQPWNFWKTRHRVGIVSSGDILTQLYDFISKAVGSNHTIARIGSDFFAVILHSSSPKIALDHAKSIAHTVEDHIFETGGISVNCYLRAGIVPYDASYHDTAAEVINQAFEVIGSFASGDASEKARLYEPPKDEKPAFDPNQTLTNLKQDGAINLTYQAIISLRDDPKELYEVWPNVADKTHNPIDLTSLAATQIGSKGESKFDRWLINLSLSKLRPQLKANPKTYLVLHLSPHALADKTLIPWLISQSRKIKIPHQHLIFQFQTNDVTDRLKAATQFFSLMRKAKMYYCFSEFSPDADTFKSLKTLKPPLLKISSDIALHASDDSGIAQQLETILSRAADMSIAVIIPHVTEAHTLASLWQSGAAYVQGDYFTVATPNMDYNFLD